MKGKFFDSFFVKGNFVVDSFRVLRGKMGVGGTLEVSSESEFESALPPQFSPWLQGLS